MKEIRLEKTLPRVFRGDERPSEVWLGEVTFRRPGLHLVTADSGTGKTSLCAFLYGTRTDYEGRICFDGEDVREFTMERWCSVRRTELAYLPQELMLFPDRTVMENLLLKNRLTDRFTEAELRGRLDRLGLGGKAAEAAGRLSVGQQQRVALIRALAQPFSFLLLDEPVSHLDESNNHEAAALVAEDARANGAAVIATSVGNPLLLDYTSCHKL